jgi:hypothetical protein
MSNILWILGIVVCLTYPIQGITGEADTYRYKLDENNNDRVCRHMSEVYNRFFKKPFSTTIDEAEYEKGGGNLPTLLPGAQNDWRSFINMRFSFLPSSPEFDAIKWREGKIKRPSHGEHVVPNVPFIAADMDISNDGQLETVTKNEFMGCYIPDPRCSDGIADVLFIFRKGDIDLQKGPIEWDTFFKGQGGKAPLAVIYGRQSTCALVRPFIYEGITYLSCYHQEWVKDFMDYRNSTPDREYTDILKYQGVEKLPGGRQPIKAETVCRFRMRVTK